MGTRPDSHVDSKNDGPISNGRWTIFMHTIWPNFGHMSHHMTTYGRTILLSYGQPFFNFRTFPGVWGCYFAVKDSRSACAQALCTNALAIHRKSNTSKTWKDPETKSLVMVSRNSENSLCPKNQIWRRVGKTLARRVRIGWTGESYFLQKFFNYSIKCLVKSPKMSYWFSIIWWRTPCLIGQNWSIRYLVKHLKMILGCFTKCLLVIGDILCVTNTYWLNQWHILGSPVLLIIELSSPKNV